MSEALCGTCGFEPSDCRCDVLEAHVPVSFVCPICFKQQNTPHDKDCKWYGTYVDGEVDKTPEAVNHPSHYGGEDNPYEQPRHTHATSVDLDLSNQRSRAAGEPLRLLHRPLIPPRTREASNSATES